MTDVNILSAMEMPVILQNNTQKIIWKNLKMPVEESRGILKTGIK